MKKYIILTPLALLLSVMVCAQGSLEFSQVKLVSSSETVPDGKVWKIVSVFSSNGQVGGNLTTSTNNSSTTKQIIINENAVHISGRAYRWLGNSIGSSAAVLPVSESAFQSTELPIWLPAGTLLAPSTGCNGISVIEFTAQ